MAASPDPRDRSTAALPRLVPVVIHALADPPAAVHLAGECARTTHQSPLVIDACRYYGAMLVCALRGEPPAAVLDGQYEPVPGLWAARPLKSAIRNMARAATPTAPLVKRSSPDAARAVAAARAAVTAAADFDDCVRRACQAAMEPGLEAALAGALWGAFHGAQAIPGRLNHTKSKF